MLFPISRALSQPVVPRHVGVIQLACSYFPWGTGSLLSTRLKLTEDMDTT